MPHPDDIDSSLPGTEPAVMNRPICCRGIRGATTVEGNDAEMILRETRILLALIIRLNGIVPADVASVIFTTTRDLTAVHPALAARQFGWMDTPLICSHEMEVPGSLPLCVRVLIHWNTTKTAEEIQHVYIKGAKKLRPDKADLPPVDWDELHRWIEAEIENNR